MGWNSRRSISLRFLFVLAFLLQMLVGVVGIAVPIHAHVQGASPFLVGLIGAAGGAIYSFMPLVSGKLSDRLNRKPFVSASLVSYGLSCFLYSFIEQPFLLIFIKVLEWVSVAAFWPAVEALIADSTDAKLEETLKAFNLSWGTAMVIGPMLGGILIDGWSIKAPFLFSLLVSLSFGLLSLMIVVEPPRRSEPGTVLRVRRGDEMADQVSAVTALASIFLFSSIGGIIMALFPSQATDLGISPFEIGSITFAFGAARVITFYQANRIEARLKKLRVLLLGSATFAIGSLLMFYSSSVFLFMLCFLIFGFGSGVSYAASISFVLRRWRFSRGYAAGVFESLIGLGYFAGPLIGGVFSEYAPNAPYMYVLALSLAVFSVQLVLRDKVSTGQTTRFE